jgi:hypothetical protein
VGQILHLLAETVGEGGGEPDASRDGAPATGAPSITYEVLNMFREQPDAVFDVDDVFKVLQDKGSDSNRDQVRNAINYVVRRGTVHRATRRGTYTLTDTSTPEAPGG